LYTIVAYSTDPLELKVKPHVDACITTGVDLTSAGITAGSGSNLSFSYFADEEMTKYAQNSKKIILSGTYYVRAENDAGCIIVDPVEINIVPVPEFTITDPAQVYRPETIDLSKTIHPDSGNVYAYTYWKDSLLQKPLPFPETVSEKGRYFIKGANTLVPECAVVEAVNVKILDPLIDAPNIFTPNGDGINDTWRVSKLSYYPACIVEIYDRSGKMLFRSQPGYPIPWDGTFNKLPIPIGTYYYRVKLNQELPFVSGSVSVIR
jgi:gliding motility-associated-like protein